MALDKAQTEALNTAKSQSKIINLITKEEKEIVLLKKKLEGREKKLLILLDSFNSDINLNKSAPRQKLENHSKGSPLPSFDE